MMRMPYADQGSFAAALEEAKFSPFVLPLNWNFRANWQLSFFGTTMMNYRRFATRCVSTTISAEAIIQYHAAMRVGQVAAAS